jgi:hypothetical protein
MRSDAMPRPTRFVVVGEGRDEHGACAKGPNLHTLREGELCGAIVTLVGRLLLERLGQHGEVLCWVPEASLSSGGRPVPPASPAETLVSEYLLPRFLGKLLNPVRLSTNELLAADFVVLCVDSELEERFLRTVSRLAPDLKDRTVPVVFQPEMEILLVQSKGPLEAAVRIPSCTSTPPSQEGDLKESLEVWLATYAPGCALNAELRQTIARHLDLSERSPLNTMAAWVSLVNGIRNAVLGTR